jgi:ribosome maturation factor RimP
MNIEEKVRNLIEEKIKENGYILDEVLYIKEDGNYFLRVVIDKNGVIDVEDCVKVTRLIDPMLDDIDYITDSYILDVCSKEKGCE